MNARQSVRVIVRTVTGMVLGLSGVYVMVYLYRWEWNRAVISGIFFLAAELVVIAMVLLGRLGRLERQVNETSRLPTRGPLEADEPVGRESPFAWLNPADSRLGVFVPLLMGAGVIFSGIAFVVEKLSGAVEHGVRADGRPCNLGTSLPSGGLIGPAAAGPAPLSAGPGPVRQHLSVALVLLLVCILTFGLVDVVADRTQSRPDPDPDHVALTLDVSVRDAGYSATAQAGALWSLCRGRLQVDSVEVTPSGPVNARLVVTGVMGEHTRRKFLGCLQDTSLDGVRAGVVATTTRPSRPEVSA